MSARKQLVVNADDFGFTPDVNRGIVDAHRRGILTATTMMANGAAFDDALRLARETPSLDIGCHLVLIGGSSPVTGKPYPATVAKLLAALARREIRPYEELAAQVRIVLDAGLRPSHLDTHKHTHLAAPVLEAVARISQEFDIRWVRRPFDFPLYGLRGSVPPMTRLVNEGLGLLRPRVHRVLERHGCRMTDHFAGFQITGRFRTHQLVRLLGFLPGGSTELMCHPGYCTDALRGAHTRLKESRAQELEALTAPETRTALEHNGIELTDYRALSRTVRLATEQDVPALNELIAASVRQLQAEDYSMGQREGALGTVFGVDPVLIEDGTYFVAVEGSEIVACGGWSRRGTPFGTGHSPARDDRTLDPARDAARIRAMFVHPARARRGLGTELLLACENAAKEAGFRRAELTATLTGNKLFRARGYQAMEEIGVPLANGELLPVIRMEKPLS